MYTADGNFLITLYSVPAAEIFKGLIMNYLELEIEFQVALAVIYDTICIILDFVT